MKTLLASLLIASAACRAADVTLAWDANVEPDLAGYRIYWGQASRSYARSNAVGLVTRGTVTNLAGGVWFFAATAYLSNGLESVFSSEVAWTNLSFGPRNLRIEQIAGTNQVSFDLTVPGPDSFVESSADLEHWTTFAWLGPRDPDLHVESFAFRIVADRPRAFWRIR